MTPAEVAAMTADQFLAFKVTMRDNIREQQRQLAKAQRKR